MYQDLVPPHQKQNVPSNYFVTEIFIEIVADSYAVVKYSTLRVHAPFTHLPPHFAKLKYNITTRTLTLIQSIELTQISPVVP